MAHLNVRRSGSRNRATTRTAATTANKEPTRATTPRPSSRTACLARNSAARSTSVVLMLRVQHVRVTVSRSCPVLLHSDLQLHLSLTTSIGGCCGNIDSVYREHEDGTRLQVAD